MHLPLSPWLSLLSTTLLALHLPRPVVAQQYSVQTIYQGAPGFWLENLRVRSNGSILVTELDQPRLLQFDPYSGQGPTIVHEFPGYLGMTGITETTPDVFAVVTGNFSLKTLKTTAGSWTVWTVDYRPKSCGKDGKPMVTKLANVAESGLLNGITYQPESGTLFIADSTVGVIFGMDATTGKYGVALNDSLTRPPSPQALEGINGIKYRGGSLYWTNSNGEYFAKVAINSRGGIVGNSVIVSNPKVNFDDFAFAADGTAYLAGGFVNQIFRLKADGSIASVAGGLNSSLVAEPTAIAFDESKRGVEKRMFYVTTGGALGDPINGTVVVGGQLLAVSY